ncbi:MAG: TIGR03986 family CRISPR-associated RAMP protein [Bacillota bacterium]
MPRHINPKRDQISAVAPYNFVPLPNRVLTVQEGLPEEFSNLWKRHDEFVPGAYSGWIDLDIKTLTPLFIRGAVFPRDGSEGNTDTDPRRSDAFQRPDGTPVIPGSSLRGMIRTLVEILSFSKIQPVSIEKPFFRDVSSKSAYDLVPEHIKEADIDMAEALFGCVRVGAKRHSAIKGRVRFEDAVAVAGGPAWYVDRPFVPKVLSSPKVTTFQHYLTQDGTQGPEHLTSYLEGDYTTIRGFKMYWHRWDDKLGLKQVKEKDEEQLLDKALKGQDTQHTIIRPVKEGVTFRGRVHFTNLAAEELGALLCALDLPEGCRHKLGMGKPLGLGTVSISCQITLIDRQKRYSTWEDNDSVEADPNVFKTAFQKMILSHAENSGETMIEANTGLTRVARLDALYTMLQWDKRPRPEQTRYMVIKGGDVARFGHKNEFRDRPVLPTPHWVAGKAEPNWENDQPKPAVTGKGGRKDKPPRRPSRQTKSFRKDGKSSRRTPGR